MSAVANATYPSRNTFGSNFFICFLQHFWSFKSGPSGQRRLDAFGRHGQFAQPPAGCMGEGVGKGSRGWRKRAFTRAKRRIASLHQNDFNTGDLGEGEDGIRRPVSARDMASVEGDLLLQRETDRLDDAAFELVLRAVWIDD